MYWEYAFVCALELSPLTGLQRWPSMSTSLEWLTELLMESQHGFSSCVFCVFPLTLTVLWAVISTFLYSEGMAPVCELEKDEPTSQTLRLRDATLQGRPCGFSWAGTSRLLTSATSDQRWKQLFTTQASGVTSGWEPWQMWLKWLTLGASEATHSP